MFLVDIPGLLQAWAWRVLDEFFAQGDEAFWVQRKLACHKLFPRVNSRVFLLAKMHQQGCVIGSPLPEVTAH